MSHEPLLPQTCGPVGACDDMKHVKHGQTGKEILKI